jgi:hypothetical protein
LGLVAAHVLVFAREIPRLVVSIVLYNGLPLILQANFGARADLAMSECFPANRRATRPLHGSRRRLIATGLYFQWTGGFFRAGRPESHALFARLVPDAVQRDGQAGGQTALLSPRAGRGPHGTEENQNSAR